MHLDWGPEVDEFRAELLAFLEEYAAPQTRTRRDFAMGVGASDDEVIPRWAREWQATLFDHGWMIPGYPPELGGRDATPVQTLVYLEEMAARGIPRSLHFPGYAIVALFFAAWIGALAVWRFGRVEERWSTQLRTSPSASPAGPSDGSSSRTTD